MPSPSSVRAVGLGGEVDRGEDAFDGAEGHVGHEGLPVRVMEIPVATAGGSERKAQEVLRDRQFPQSIKHQPKVFRNLEPNPSQSCSPYPTSPTPLNPSLPPIVRSGSLSSACWREGQHFFVEG